MFTIKTINPIEDFINFAKESLADKDIRMLFLDGVAECFLMNGEPYYRFIGDDGFTDEFPLREMDIADLPEFSADFREALTNPLMIVCK